MAKRTNVDSLYADIAYLIIGCEAGVNSDLYSRLTVEGKQLVDSGNMAGKKLTFSTKFLDAAAYKLLLIHRSQSYAILQKEGPTHVLTQSGNALLEQLSDPENFVELLNKYFKVDVEQIRLSVARAIVRQTRGVIAPAEVLFCFQYLNTADSIRPEWKAKLKGCVLSILEQLKNNRDHLPVSQTEFVLMFIEHFTAHLDRVNRECIDEERNEQLSNYEDFLYEVLRPNPEDGFNVLQTFIPVGTDAYTRHVMSHPLERSGSSVGKFRLQILNSLDLAHKRKEISLINLFHDPYSSDNLEKVLEFFTAESTDDVAKNIIEANFEMGYGIFTLSSIVGNPFASNDLRKALIENVIEKIQHSHGSDIKGKTRNLILGAYVDCLSKELVNISEEDKKELEEYVVSLFDHDMEGINLLASLEIVDADQATGLISRLYSRMRIEVPQSVLRNHMSTASYFGER